jgi:hypothetical protein
MEDLFDRDPYSKHRDRIVLIREVIRQINLDQETYRQIHHRLEAGNGDESDREELRRIKVRLKNNLALYNKLNSTDIEGVICSRLDKTGGDIGFYD